MKPYQPSLIAPAGGLVLLLLLAVVGGALVGAVFSGVAKLVYVALLFPLFIGLLVGGLVSTGVRLGKIRHPMVAVGSAGVATLAAYAALWGGSYLQAQSGLAAGQVGFIDYLGLVNQQGIYAVRLLNGQVELLNLGPVISAMYGVLELVLIGWLAIDAGRKAALAPFSEVCGRWFEKPALMGTLGSRRTQEVLKLIEAGQFLKLGEELQTNPALPNLGLLMTVCEQAGGSGEAYLVLCTQTRDSRGNPAQKEVVAGVIGSVQAKDLLQGIENRKALYGI